MDIVLVVFILALVVFIPLGIWLGFALRNKFPQPVRIVEKKKRD